MSTDTVSPLRQCMIEDVNSRKLGAHLQRSHICHRCPGQEAGQEARSVCRSIHNLARPS